jgi:hypothetical protein
MSNIDDEGWKPTEDAHKKGARSELVCHCAGGSGLLLGASQWISAANFVTRPC